MSRIAQAGAIAVREEDGVLEFLVVTARRNPGDWIYPKGHVEQGESDRDAALRELREEAGVIGDAIARVGTISFARGAAAVEVAYYLVRARETVPTTELRTIRWLPYEQAREQLTYENARALLDRAFSMLNGTESAG